MANLSFLVGWFVCWGYHYYLQRAEGLFGKSPQLVLAADLVDYN